MKKFFIVFCTILFNSLLPAQNSRYFIPLNIQDAYINNTRSYDGKPGKDYWQNKADYNIRINFDPVSRLLKGYEEIVYYNNSPDTLNELVFHIFPDLYKKGNSRDFDINVEDEMNGLSITRMMIGEKEVEFTIDNKNLSQGHTSFNLCLDNPVLPESKINLIVEWNYFVNLNSNIRTGGIDSSSFFIAYFFPRLAVYDDVSGWNHFDYTGDAEFYNDFGNYKLEITVPKNFIVWATGILQNPNDVLKEKYLTLYNKAQTSEDIIHIIESADILNKDITHQKSFNTWRFNSENVTDVAFALSDHYLWDATSLEVDRKTGRKILINVAYNKSSQDFYEVTGIAKKSIDYMSNNLPGVPFPFPSITVFNGLDYMEYPMMVNDTTVNIEYAYELTTHEVFHSYFPFYMGINETNYAWMDEGITSFFTYLLLKNVYPDIEANQPFGDEYKSYIGNFGDEPLFVNSNKLKRPHYNYVYYDKALSFFLVLNDFLGDDLFKSTFKEFMNRWNGKHPTPYDLFFTFENMTGENLQWLIKPWFFEYGYVDLSIADVKLNNENYEIEIQKTGLLPAHFSLQIYYSAGSSDTLNYKASVWKNGERILKIILPADRIISEVEIIDKTLRDADLRNNKIIFH